MKNLLVSIVIPCYNQAHFLNATIDSVKNQKYQNWECIIVNDGSPDNTEDIAEKWVQKDSRFIYINQKNGGLSNARNTGLKKAKGDYILCLDSDDLIHKEKLSKSIELINSENSKVVVTDFLRFKNSIKQLRPAYCKLSYDLLNYESILLNWDSQFTLPVHTVIFSKDLVNDISFNEELKAKEDWVFWLDIFKQNPKASYINEPLVFYRKNANSMTKNFNHMQRNINIAYTKIYKELDDSDLKKLFLDKIIKDNSKKITKQHYKIIKYKSIVKKLLITSSLLLIALMSSFFI